MAKPVGVTVIGLRELQARLAAASEYEPRQVREIVSNVAQIVVDEAIPEMKSQFVSEPSRMDGKLEESLRTSASASKRGISASVIEGKGTGSQDSAMYAGVWEFGGYPGKRKFVKQGRALFPTAKKHRDRLVAAVEAAMEELARIIEGD